MFLLPWIIFSIRSFQRTKLSISVLLPVEGSISQKNPHRWYFFFLRLCLELVNFGQINRKISGAHTNLRIPSVWARHFAAIKSAIEADLISMCSRLFKAQCTHSEGAETPFLYSCSLKTHVWVKYQGLWDSPPPPSRPKSTKPLSSQ